MNGVMVLRVLALSVLLSAAAPAVAQLLPGERPAAVGEIPGVIGAGATWELVWADFKTADGLVGTADGGVLFAQEQGDTIRKLDANNHESIYLTETHGTGFLAGFYAPFPLTVAFEPAAWFEDVDAALSQGNVDPARTARSGRTLLVPPLAIRDVFVAAGSDLRYEIGKVQVTSSVGDVPLIGDVEFRQIPFGDIDYTLAAPSPPPTAP